MDTVLQAKLAKLNFTVDNVKESYSGKPGCMCGCVGNYSEKKSTAVRAFNRLVNDPSVRIDEEAKCIYVKTSTRNNVVFFN